MFLRSLLNEEPVKTVVAPEAPRSDHHRPASKEREKVFTTQAENENNGELNTCTVYIRSVSQVEKHELFNYCLDLFSLYFPYLDVGEIPLFHCNISTIIILQYRQVEL